MTQSATCVAPAPELLSISGANTAQRARRNDRGPCDTWDNPPCR